MNFYIGSEETLGPVHNEVQTPGEAVLSQPFSVSISHFSVL